MSLTNACFKWFGLRNIYKYCDKLTDALKEISKKMKLDKNQQKSYEYTQFLELILDTAFSYHKARAFSYGKWSRSAKMS